VSQATALQKAQAFKTVLQQHGVPEVSIELLEGRPVSGDRWDSLQVVTNFDHHVDSRYSPSSLTPVLSLCKKGRSDLPGPLCNGYGGWDLCYRIITFGLANHPGEGGPISVPKTGGGSYRIPQDSARKYAWGTEFEGGDVESDWDRVLKNPRTGKQMTFREFMGRVGAAVQDYFGLPRGAHLEHLTWAPGRKVDRLHYTQAKGVTEIQKYSSVITTPKPPSKPPTTQPEEIDMAAREDILNYTKACCIQIQNHNDQMLANTADALVKYIDTTRDKIIAADDISDEALKTQLDAVKSLIEELRVPNATAPEADAVTA
jgi:hypothetical protein